MNWNNCSLKMIINHCNCQQTDKSFTEKIKKSNINKYLKLLDLY